MKNRSNQKQHKKKQIQEIEKQRNVEIASPPPPPPKSMLMTVCGASMAYGNTTPSSTLNYGGEGGIMLPLEANVIIWCVNFAHG